MIDLDATTRKLIAEDLWRLFERPELIQVPQMRRLAKLWGTLTVSEITEALTRKTVAVWSAEHCARVETLKELRKRSPVGPPPPNCVERSRSQGRWLHRRRCTGR